MKSYHFKFNLYELLEVLFAPFEQTIFFSGNLRLHLLSAHAPDNTAIRACRYLRAGGRQAAIITTPSLQVIRREKHGARAAFLRHMNYPPGEFQSGAGIAHIFAGSE